MNIRIQLGCIHAIPVFILIYCGAFIGLCQFVPPPSPTMSPSDLMAMFDQHRELIRVGQLICLVSSVLYLPWSAVMSVQMARVEGAFPVLACLQLAGAMILVVFFILCSMLWTVAAFRADQDPLLLRMLNDFSWLTFVMVYPEYIVQLTAIALVGLMDTRDAPLLPRWACFATLWVAFTGIGGGFATFFKSGPFAWNGLIGFWIPVVCFLFWLLFVIYPLLLKHVKRQSSRVSTDYRELTDTPLRQIQ